MCQQPCFSPDRSRVALWTEKFTTGTLGQGDTAASQPQDYFLLTKAHPLGDVVCGGHFHASPRAACLCASASCPRAPGAVLLWGGKSTGLWCSIDCFSLCVINTEPPQTDLICSAPDLGGIHVFQICLKVHLHSSIFLTSLLYFLGTSTCCQFSRFGGPNAVLLQCLLCFEQSRVEVISPLAMLADSS